MAVAALVVALAGCGGGSPSPSPSPAPPPPAPEATPPARRPSASVVVWAVGDGAAADSDAKAVVDRMVADGIDRLLYLGDVYETGSAEDFARYYAPTYGRLAKITWPTPGNHEWPSRSEGYDPYWRQVTGAVPREYYSVRAGGWQLLSLNSETAHDTASPQLRWLRAAVRGPGNCRIAFWHRPRFSAGVRHGDQPDIQPIWSALRGRARIALTGHEHDMQRFAPSDGITEFVSGAGGHEHYALRPRAGLAFGDDTHYGALRLVLRPGRARWAFVADDGATLDRGTIRCKRG